MGFCRERHKNEMETVVLVIVGTLVLKSMNRGIGRPGSPRTNQDHSGNRILRTAFSL